MLKETNFDEVIKTGYLHRDIDPALNLFAEIEKLKKEKENNPL